MRFTGKRLSFTVLVIAFALGSITILQLLLTMDEIEYSQAGYFNISKSDRARSIWNGEPVVFFEGRPNHRVRSENPNNVTSQELLAWKQVLWGYRGYLEEMGIRVRGLGISPLNGTLVLEVCDLTEEKVELFVDTMEHYVPMGVVVLVNECLVGYGLPLKSETQFNVFIGLNKYVFDSQDTAKIIITNKDSYEITFGVDYIIQKLVDGEWVKASPFPPNSAFIAILQILPAGRTTTQEIKIDTLESGHYRVSKTITHERTQTELTFILEFDIIQAFTGVFETVFAYTNQIGTLDWNYFHNEEAIEEHPEYFQNESREAILTCYDSFLEIYSITEKDVQEIANLPNVHTVYPAFIYTTAIRLNSTQVMMINEQRLQEGRPLILGNWSSIDIVAIEPEAELIMTARSDCEKGRFLQPSDDRGVVINEQLEGYVFSLGMNLSAYCTFFQEEEYNIVGIYSGLFPQLSGSSSLAVISLQEFFNSLELDFDEGRYNWLYVVVDEAGLDDAMQRIREIIPEAIVFHT